MDRYWPETATLVSACGGEWGMESVEPTLVKVGRRFFSSSMSTTMPMNDNVRSVFQTNRMWAQRGAVSAVIKR